MTLISDLRHGDPVDIPVRSDKGVLRAQLDTFLGRGGNGFVFKGRCVKYNKEGEKMGMSAPVAVKLMSWTWDSCIEDVQKELSIMRLIGNYERSPCTANILCYLDVFKTLGSKVCIVMELIEGVDMQQWLEAIIQDEEEMPRYDLACDLYLKLARALAHIHKHGVAHGDVKPANIMVSSKGEPYLVDFGLSCLMEACRENASLEDGTIMGTKLYLPPEHERKPTLSAIQAYDVWALGFSFYSLIHGTNPIPYLKYGGGCNLLPIVSENRPLNWALALSLTCTSHERNSAQGVCMLLEADHDLGPPPIAPTYFAFVTAKRVLDALAIIKEIEPWSATGLHYLFAGDRGNQRYRKLLRPDTSLRLLMQNRSDSSLYKIINLAASRSEVMDLQDEVAGWFREPVTVELLGVDGSPAMVQYQRDHKGYLLRGLVFVPNDDGQYFLCAHHISTSH